MNDSTWTWMSGSNITNSTGVYGEKGIVSVENVPGARIGAAGWYDGSTQELWLFGGFGFSTNVSSFGALLLNDCV